MLNKFENSSEEEGYTEVFAWGADRYGQLGLGNKQCGRCYCVPRFCTFNVVIRTISCGEEHSAFITNRGQLFTMGSNAEGRLGIGDRTIKLSSTPCLVEVISTLNAVSVACGWGHTAAVTDEGDLYTWGVGDYGALGVADSVTQWFPVRVAFQDKFKVCVKNVSCGTRHTAMVDAKGRLLVCGAGDAGQLGTGVRESERVPVPVSFIKEPVRQTACGIFHTLVLTESGAVLAMGGNNFGQLGTGTKRSSTIPVITKGLEREYIVKIAAGHVSAALSERGEMFIWGTGVFGERLIPTVLSGESVENISVGGCFGAAVDAKGNLYCWGANSSGELGLGDYEPRTSLTLVTSLQGKSVTQISCGGSYGIALGRTLPHKYVPPSRRAGPIPESSETRPRIPSIAAREKLREELEVSQRISRQTEMYNQTESISRASRQDISRASRQGQIYSPSSSSYVKKSPIAGHGRVNDELLGAYKDEQEKRKLLERRISDLQEQNKNIQDKLRERQIAMKIKEQEFDQRYREKLEVAEKQLNSERLKAVDMERRLQEEQDREAALTKAKVDLQSRAIELESQIAQMHKENLNEREDQIAHTAGENARLSSLLKDYEDRIEGEIDDRHRVLKEKNKEINGLHGEINRQENAITEAQDHKMNLKLYYQGEKDRYQAMIDDQKEKLAGSKAEKAKQLEIAANDQLELNTLKDNIAMVDMEIENCRANLKKLVDEIEQIKRNIKQKEFEIEDVGNLHSNLLLELEERENDLRNLEIWKAEEAKRQLEVQRLIDTLSVKQVEIETLKKDVGAWEEVVNGVRNDNSSLKQEIEELETKNKKLLEGLNLHLYNRAADYKERTIKALKQSPFSGEKYARRRSRHVTPSPERFTKYMEEQKKTTTAGVGQASHMTQFKAETTANIKNSLSPSSISPLQEPRGRNKFVRKGDQVSFDGKFVMDQEDYHMEEDPKYVKSNYVLVQMLEEYQKPESKVLNVQLEEVNYQGESITIQLKNKENNNFIQQSKIEEAKEPLRAYQPEEYPLDTPTRFSPPNVSSRHEQIMRSTQELLRVLGTPSSRERSNVAAVSAFMTPAVHSQLKGKASAKKSGYSITPSTAMGYRTQLGSGHVSMAQSLSNLGPALEEEKSSENPPSAQSPLKTIPVESELVSSPQQEEADVHQDDIPEEKEQSFGEEA